MKTAEGLVKYATAQLGKPYWYGTFGQIASESLFNTKKKQYPDYYDQKKYKVRFDKQYGQRVHDCAGLIKGYLFSDSPASAPVYNRAYDWGANTMLKSKCSEKGKIDNIPEIPGVLVFYTNHVGVYIGNGYVIEAKGHDYGVVKTLLKGRGWTHWGKLSCIDYSVKKVEKKEIKAGLKLTLKDKRLYASSSASIPTKKITGEYFLYDGKLVNGKYRITNKESSVGKFPAFMCVTGWVNKEDI